jgi:hypothetical protein
MDRKNGVVLWQGPSRLNGAPVVVIATGLRRPSTNVKTAGMVQVWILPLDRNPVAAQRSGHDRAVCGDCPLRPALKTWRAGQKDAARADARRLGWRTFSIGTPGPGEILCPASKESGRRTRCAKCLLCNGTRHGKRSAVKDIAINDHGHGRCYVRTGEAPLSIYRAFRRGRYPRASFEILTGKAVRIGAYGDPAAAPPELWLSIASVALAWMGYTHQWRRPDMQVLRGVLMASI